MRVLLWDIDGTLINNDRAGMHAWAQALEEENGGPVDVSGLRTAGMTDVRIAQMAIEETLGRAWDPALAGQLLHRYTELLPEWLQRRSAGRVLPGVLEVLDAAAGRVDLELALLTGNIERGARLKLQHYGLWDRFAWGAFADDTPDRRDIARRARADAERRHPRIEALYVIGDTAHDIDCGKAIGARTIAVGTGPYGAEELAGHDPWWAVETVPAAEQFLARVLGD